MATRKRLTGHVGFKKLTAAIAKKGKVSNPAAVAAAVGFRKYGKAGMEEKAAAGRKKAGARHRRVSAAGRKLRRRGA